MVSTARPAPATAVEMARRQREISVSEFFLKNHHLLGFDTPAKALVTAVREAVDNALDACEEAGVLPEIKMGHFDIINVGGIAGNSVNMTSAIPS